MSVAGGRFTLVVNPIRILIVIIGINVEVHGILGFVTILTVGENHMKNHCSH